MTSKMTYKISDSDTLKLIKEVKNRPCIWNQDHSNYGERHHLAEAWIEIAKKIDQPEELLRIKWKNLRDCFRKEVKKNNVETVEDYSGKWRHFKTLSFLMQEGEAQTESEEEIDQIDTSEFEIKYVPESLENLEFSDEPAPVPEKRPKTMKKSDEDYDMMFLKSLTPFLKQLEPTRNLVARSRMQDILLNEISAQEASRSGKSKKTANGEVKR